MFPFLVGLSVLISGGVADFIAENRGPLSADKLYAGSLGAGIFLVFGPLIEAWIAQSAGPRSRVDLWRAIQFSAVLSSVATWFQLAPLFNRPSYLSGVSSRWEQLEPEHLLLPVGAAIAAFVVRRQTVPSKLPVRAAVSFLVALGVLCGAEVRLRRAVQPWALLDHLPVVAILPDIDRSRGFSATSRLRDDLWVRRYWSSRYADTCDVSLARTEAELRAEIAPENMVPIGCGEITLRELAVTHEMVLVGPPMAYRSAFVLDGTTFARRPVGSASVGDYTRRLAPPRGWVRASWCLLALSALAFFSRRGSKRWLGARDRWREGTLGADGTLRLSDGSTAPLSYGESVAPGPVVVLVPLSRLDGGPFRGGEPLVLAPGDLRAGTLGTVQAELEAARDAVWVRLTATAWLAMAPMVPYVMRGMVF